MIEGFHQIKEDSSHRVRVSCGPCRLLPDAALDATRVRAQKKHSPLQPSPFLASILRSLNGTRTMAKKKKPMGLTSPAAFAMETIRLQGVDHPHFSMSVMRSIRASTRWSGSSFSALGGTGSYPKQVTARKDLGSLRIASGRWPMEKRPVILRPGERWARGTRLPDRSAPVQLFVNRIAVRRIITC